MLTKLFIGVDVHKDSVMVAVLPSDAKDPTRFDRLPNDAPRLRRYFRALVSEWPIQACYEASGTGFELWRNLRAWGIVCDVIAPSLTPVRPGERRKHDRRDAAQLARLLRAGELVAIRVLTEAEERVRDLVRCRGTLQAEVVRSCHYVLKFLPTGPGLPRRRALDAQAFAWLHRLRTGDELQGEDTLTFGEYLALFEYKLQRREELDRQVEELSRTSVYHAIVARLCAFRGIKTYAAMVLATEVGPWQRFDSPRH